MNAMVNARVRFLIGDKDIVCAQLKSGDTNEATLVEEPPVHTGVFAQPLPYIPPGTILGAQPAEVIAIQEGAPNTAPAPNQ